MTDLKVVGSGPRDPEGPMLEQRVARLEKILERLKPKITEILLTGAKQNEIHKIQVDLAEVKGKVSMLPTWWMLIVALIATWNTGTAIVFALLKASHP